MSNSIFSNIVCSLRKLATFKRPAAHNNRPGFTKLNGSATLINGEWRDVIINGDASLGSREATTNFRGLIIANGSANVSHASFYSFEVNGSATLDTVEIRNTLQIQGNAVIRGCTIDRLIIYGAKTQVEITDSVIRSQQTLS